jgi:hypothetical protein
MDYLAQFSVTAPCVSRPFPEHTGFELNTTDHPDILQADERAADLLLPIYGYDALLNTDSSMHD